MAFKNVEKPEIMKGIKFWKNPGNKFHVLMLNYRADPGKDPEREGAKWYEDEKEGTPKVVWNKEYEIDFATKSGKLIYGPEFCDFSPDIHLINSFELGKVELLISLDFGQRNPNGALIGALTRDNVIYIIDEYYNPAIPSVASREMFKKFGYLMGDLEGKSIRQKKDIADETFQTKVIDPSTCSKNRTKIKEGEEIPYSVIEDFEDNGWEFEPAQNNVDAGITRVREYFQLRDGKAHLYIFRDKCPKLVEELASYRYQENSDMTSKTKNESEKPVKKDDHLCIAGDSLVNTVNGDIPIKDLVDKEGYVYCYKDRITVNKFSNVVKTGFKKTIKLTLNDDTELSLTRDHPVLLRGGDYIEAGELKEGDSLMPFDRLKKHNHKVVKIEEGIEQDVYNMSVENTNNFACEGIILHNCDSLRYLISTRPNKPEDISKPKTRIQKDIESLIKPKIIDNDWDIS